MKEFKTLQELWAYCLFCPFCKEICRSIDISIGPEASFKLISYKKENQFLSLHCTWQKRNIIKYKFAYTINTTNNNYKIDVSEINEDESKVEMTLDKNLEEEEKHRLRHRASKLYSYFYIHSDCRKCGSAFTNTSDIEFDHATNQVSGFKIEREIIYVLQNKDKYHLTIMHDDNKTLISKCVFNPDTYDLVDDDKVFECPVVNFDFSDTKKLINKIKTLITFS